MLTQLPNYQLNKYNTNYEILKSWQFIQNFSNSRKYVDKFRNEKLYGAIANEYDVIKIEGNCPKSPNSIGELQMLQTLLCKHNTLLWGLNHGLSVLRLGLDPTSLVIECFEPQQNGSWGAKVNFSNLLFSSSSLFHELLNESLKSFLSLSLSQRSGYLVRTSKRQFSDFENAFTTCKFFQKRVLIDLLYERQEWLSKTHFLYYLKIMQPLYNKTHTIPN